MNDTELSARGNYFKIQWVNLFARELGFQMVVSEEERVSIHEDRRGAVGQALLDDGRIGQALRHLRALSLDEGAPEPLAR